MDSGLSAFTSFRPRLGMTPKRLFIRRPGHVLQLDEARDVIHRRTIGQPMYGSHFIDEYGRCQRLLQHDLVAEDGLQFVFSTAERHHKIRMIMNMKVDGLAGSKPHFPHPDMLVLQHDLVPDWTKRNAVRRGSL